MEVDISIPNEGNVCEASNGGMRGVAVEAGMGGTGGGRSIIERGEKEAEGFVDVQPVFLLVREVGRLGL